MKDGNQPIVTLSEFLLLYSLNLMIINGKNKTPLSRKHTDTITEPIHVNICSKESDVKLNVLLSSNYFI